jgi:TM2 domain-containing membrane protein YozV
VNKVEEKKEETSMSSKNRFVTLALCFFFGWFGVHRFYAGKYVTGFFQMLTFGGFGFWMFLDLIRILIGSFKDKDGKVILNWH